MSSKIVPFGKYKGQPVEALVADREYAEWALAQPWFRERFRDVYQVVINYGAEPQETPEHNAMQARFLDDGLCLRLWALLDPTSAEVANAQPGQVMAEAQAALKFLVDERVRSLQGKHAETIDRIALHKDNLAQKRSGENVGADGRSIAPHDLLERWLRESRSSLAAIDEHLARVSSPSFVSGEAVPTAHKAPAVTRREFESGGWDVVFTVAWRASAGWLANEDLVDRWQLDSSGRHHVTASASGGGTVAIECKPTMGDDFPAVLRQVKAHRGESARRCVVVGGYTGEGATLDQVRAMFATSGIALVLMGDLA